jgi:hypothetical protein
MAGTAEAIAHLTPCDPGPEEAAMNRVGHPAPIRR